MERQVKSLEEMKVFAKELLFHYPTHKVFVFDGPMGVGKTTLIQMIGSQLGTTDTISSPTFSIVNEYQIEKGILYHFDFYRLEDEEEAYDMGYEEYFYSDQYCFIEWPSKIPNLIPENALYLHLELGGNQERKIKVKEI